MGLWRRVRWVCDGVGGEQNFESWKLVDETKAHQRLSYVLK